MVTNTPASVTTAVAAVIQESMAAAGLTELSLAESADIPRTTLRRRLSGASPFTVAELSAIGEELEMPVSLILARAEGRTRSGAAA